MILYLNSTGIKHCINSSIHEVHEPNNNNRVLLLLSTTRGMFYPLAYRNSEVS